MRRLISCLVTGALLAAIIPGNVAAGLDIGAKRRVCSPSQAGPQPLPDETVDPVCLGLDLSDDAAAELVSSGTGSSVRSGTSGSGVTYVPYNQLTTAPDGQPCITTGTLR